VEHRNYKVVYRRYASLFFLVGVDNDEDFEALTLNLLARTIETVEGGGLIILLPSLRPDSQRYRALVLSDAVATLRLKFIRSRRACNFPMHGSRSNWPMGEYLSATSNFL
jgi:hypothetical protein